MLRRFLDFNLKIARWLNNRLPVRLRTDGNYWFQENVLRKGFRPGETVYDLGGGSRPWFSVEDKTKLNLTVVGLDLSAEELRDAPAGSYDRMIAADLCVFQGDATADKVICQATLEHVPDTENAIRGIASVLRPGGEAYIFAPCRNALFARLNRILPEGLKQRLLTTGFSYAEEGHDGFAAPYDRCTPSQISASAAKNGLTVVEGGVFWTSGYFYIFIPAYLVWRLFQLISWRILGDDACELFYFVLRKN